MSTYIHIHIYIYTTGLRGLHTHIYGQWGVRNNEGKQEQGVEE